MSIESATATFAAQESAPPIRLRNRANLFGAVCGGITVSTFVFAMLFDLAVNGTGESSSSSYPAKVGFILAAAASIVVGTALTARRPYHASGWSFLLLGGSLAASAIFDGYAHYGLIKNPGSVPGAELSAIIGDSMFLFFLLPLALLLLVTPSGKLPTSHTGWKVVWWSSVFSAVMAFVLKLLAPADLAGVEFRNVSNPWELSSLSTELGLIRFVFIAILHLDIIIAAWSQVVRFRRAGPVERLQLRWFVIAAAFLPPSILLAWVFAYLENEMMLAITAGIYVAVLPIAAAFAIEQYHLYDVDRLLSRALTYVLLSIALAFIYGGTVVSIGRSIPSSNLVTAVATLVAAVAARPVRDWLQDRLDRRFNRREYEAVATIRRYVDEPSRDASLLDTLRHVLERPRLRTGYWLEDRQLWVDSEGIVVRPPATAIKVRRRDELVAFIDPGTPVESRLLETVASEARPELENERLRAAIVLQLAEVRQSRARIVAAQVAERRRIERNLHDGAQQMLLSVAMQLRSATANPGNGAVDDAITTAVTGIRRAVRELRELANGLHPAILNEGGLAAALDDLAGRAPVAVRLDVAPGRLPADVEAAAWFIACEAVTNAVKHAAPESLDIVTRRKNGHLELEVIDDGAGGADANGQGLRGIADRAEAIGGELRVSARPGGGTIVRAVLPCV